LRQIGTVRRFAFPYPLLLLAIWTGVLLAGDYIVLDTSVRQFRSRSFAATVGEITRSEMGHGAVSRRGIDIGYSYTVNGADYPGHRYRYDDRNGAFDYKAVTNAWPRGAKKIVYYDASNPAESLLDPGLKGCDLLLGIFAIPLNIATAAIWLAAFRASRESGRLKVAGGVRVFQDDRETRARLAQCSPLAAGFFGIAAAAFASAMLVVLAAGFAPGMGLMTAVLIAIAAAGAAAFFWTAQRHAAGHFDLRSHAASQTVAVPPAGGRKEVLLVPKGEIVAVALRRRVTRAPSGEYFSYVPALDRAVPGAEAQSLDLINWGWNEWKARAFAGWLSDQLGVPLKSMEDEPAMAPASSRR
jgi:hypothetical protein